MKVDKDFKNELMKRREVSLVVESSKNPTYPEALKIVADHFKGNEENVMVENVRGKFGRSTFLIKASIYDTKELKEEAVKRLTKPKKTSAA
jgi:ribosomal protein S24E